MSEFPIGPISGLPVLRRRGTSIWPFASLNVGDSFSLPVSDRPRLTASAAIYKAKHAGWSYTTRTIVNPNGTKTVRIWRTA
jgi:hypothetical protein